MSINLEGWLEKGFTQKDFGGALGHMTSSRIRFRHGYERLLSAGSRQVVQLLGRDLNWQLKGRLMLARKNN